MKVRLMCTRLYAVFLFLDVFLLVKGQFKTYAVLNNDNGLTAGITEVMRVVE